MGVDILSYHPYDIVHASRLTFVHTFPGMKGPFSFHFFSSQETIVKYKSEVRKQQLENYPLGKSTLLQNRKIKVPGVCITIYPTSLVIHSPALWNLETRGSAKWLPKSLRFLLNFSPWKGKPTVCLLRPCTVCIWGKHREDRSLCSTLLFHSGTDNWGSYDSDFPSFFTG